VLLNSAAAIYVIPHACHLVTCSDSYIWQNLCWGNCKYVNKMHIIKWRTNRMLSSYINNNRLFNLTWHNAHRPKQLQMFLYCVSTGWSGHALWPAASATVGCLFLSMTRDLPWPLNVTHTVVYRPVEARDFTRGRQVQVYCCLVSYRRHCHVCSVAHVVVLMVCVYRISALSQNILTSF